MLERALQFLNRIPADKVAHFAGGSILAAVGCLPLKWLGLWPSVGLVFFVAWGKEIWDHNNPPHTADPWDIAATLLGGFPVWIVVLLRSL